MSINRRNFLRNASLGAGFILSGFRSQGPARPAGNDHQPTSQLFNMCNHAAPKIPVVRIGIIGLGNRGSSAVVRLARIEGVEIKALCDQHEAMVQGSQEDLKSNGLPEAAGYYGSKVIWKELCQREDLDLIYICTDWDSHTPMCVYGMEMGKHVATEVPAATTLEECWQLVETSEKTRKHCMMLENCCYDFFELLTLNMTRQGYFGELVHAEGAYIHTLLGMNFNKPDRSRQKDHGYTDMWRLKENKGRNGNLYPTHGLGPICQALNINRGDQMEYLTATSTMDFQMAQKARELASDDSFYEPFVGNDYRGNMNTTVVKTVRGKTMLIQHDVTSPRVYSRIHLLSGTKGMARKFPKPAWIARGHHKLNEAEMKAVETKYTPEIIKKVGEMAKQVGGHGGMDFIMDWRLIDCLRNGLPLDQDVYEAALWSSIAPLSEHSVARRSHPVDVPDFTLGSWKKNKPVDISLQVGGNTGVANR